MACTQRAPPPERLAAPMAPSVTPCGGVAGVGAGSGTGAVRVRTVRLSRRAAPGTTPGPGPGLGFSLRGGREHGTGFFVSAVEFGSEAHLHGLRVGDQLLRINGFSLNQATHREVLQLVSNQTSLTLKVKTVGVLPVKDKSNDPLTWRIVPERLSKLPPPPSPHASPPETAADQLRIHLQQQQHQRQQSGSGSASGASSGSGDLVRMVIQVPHKAKLGCGICRGPDWRPGIFVQFTKEGGPAREAGLRPGDQLLQCNGTPFADIAFAEAVSAMKSASTLDLLVRRSAGRDLFPGESSGYNSSASSVAGGDSPSWDEPLNTPLPPPCSAAPAPAPAPPGRLATLREGDEHRSHPDWGRPPHVTTTGNLCTVIRLESPDNGWVSGTQDEADTAIRDSERTTVVVQVHRSEADDDGRTCVTRGASTPPGVPGPPAAPVGAPRLCSSPSSSSLASNSCSASLSSAISQELQRRSEQRQQAQERAAEDPPPTPPPAPAPPPPPPPPKPSPLASVLPADQHKREQHERLMDEFRRAHRKMFAHAVAEANAAGAAAPGAAKPLCKGSTPRADQEREHFLQRRQQLEQQHAAQVSAGLALSAARERGLRVERDRQDAQEAEREVTRLVRRNGPRHPPPPLPQAEQPAGGEDAAEDASAAAPATASPAAAASVSVVTNGQTASPPPASPAATGGPASAASAFQVKLKPVHVQEHGVVAPVPRAAPAAAPAPPPYCPTPDYDSDSSSATSAARGQSTKVMLNGPEVEMQSMDSMELLEPRPAEPRPPHTYFHRSAARPSVCVTIREYAGANSRQPSKFTFLNNRQPNDQDSIEQEPAACRLQTELATTLSRSNLRNRIETVPAERATSLEVKESSKPDEDITRGRITFTSVNGSSGSPPSAGKGSLPNGILKKVAVGHLASNGLPVGHGITPAALAGAGAALNRTKTSGPTAKTISFGAKATIINEKSIPS